MNDEKPPQSSPPVVRVRTHPFWWPWVLFVALLYTGALWVIRLSETQLSREYHGTMHYYQLETSLHLLEYYEQEPPAIRWFSGYFSPWHIYREAGQLARAAEKDGYLTASARQAMACLALRMNDPESAAYWRDGKEPSALPLENVDALATLTAGAGLPVRSIIESSGGDYKPAAGGTAYWQAVWIFGCDLLLLIVCLPCAWRLARLFRSAREEPSAPVSTVMQAWQPSTVMGGWLIACFLFAFGGMLFTAGSAATLLYESAHFDSPLPGPVYSILTAVEEASLFLFSSWHGDIVIVLLLVLPVVLMCRWFAGGLRGAVRLFGLRSLPGGWKKTVDAAFGGLWLCIVLAHLENFVSLAVPWVDPRDGWRFEGEALWHGILLSAIMAPLVEEFIFRGFLFNAFSNRWHPAVAAVLSSLIFALAHAYSVSGTVSTAIFGILCCIIYRRTGSLWSAIILHSAWNLMFTLLLHGRSEGMM